MRLNIFSADLITSSIDALDGLIQNKLVSLVVAEKDTIDLIQKIMKSHDFNEVIHIFLKIYKF